ncbi:transposable element Tcb1 transposase [Trichonephila clavipes]|uniref:Transposable element Tcb1 transposase n=1 Tax=Trichonephila clavipes TaxID=2585209 RepID=A0A8X6VHF8_TRICX|nr:transposable element Tcb1 transposase [Trichonephila clavipes]
MESARHQENTIERNCYGSAGWFVWGGIIFGYRTDLHVQSVTIYRDAILEQHVRLFRGAIGAEILFMDDKARPRRTNIVDECLQSEDITRMDWPANSPDLNPIEHVWDMLRRRIAARQPHPTCLPELRRALLDAWCNIPQDHTDNLILIMPRRYVFPFFAPMGLGSFELLSLNRSHPFRHIPAQAPWAPMSGYTLCVSRRAAVTESGATKTHC